MRVVPDKQGYLIDVAVYKELENVEHPDHATAGQATFRNDASLTRVVDSLGEQDTNQGWIPQGRDPALEQRILSEILARAGSSARLPVAAHGRTRCLRVGERKAAASSSPATTWDRAGIYP